jgi:hypothetical protein
VSASVRNLDGMADRDSGSVLLVAAAGPLSFTRGRWGGYGGRTPTILTSLASGRDLR